MCGIAGVLIPSQQIAPGLLEPMADRLAHRGPDGRGFFVEGPVGLAHTRLSIIDLEGGQQPILTDDGSLALVANGEIYNFVELMEELRAEGRPFSTHSDTETIVQAYALDPVGFVDRLHGMFAFAIYDRIRRKPPPTKRSPSGSTRPDFPRYSNISDAPGEPPARSSASPNSPSGTVSLSKAPGRRSPP